MEAPISQSADVNEQITDALKESGWTVVDGVTPNVVATESRRFWTWGVYSVEAELEVAPVGEGFVRVFIHPYRHYFTGARGKIPYLSGGLAKSVMKTIQEPFEERGLRFVGTAQSRDKAFRESGR